MKVLSCGNGDGGHYLKGYEEKASGVGDYTGCGVGDGNGDGWGTSTGFGDGDGVYDSGDSSGNGRTSNGFKEWYIKIK